MYRADKSRSTSPPNNTRLMNSRWYTGRGMLLALVMISFTLLGRFMHLLSIIVQGPFIIIWKSVKFMSQSLCECHCGTRIDLDEQLLEEREMWKQKYLCLQKQVKVDIQTLKDNIYAECAAIMQQEFSEKEQAHNKFVNQKNVEVKDLISRIIGLETQVKVLSKEKEILEQRAKENDSQITERDETISSLRRKMDKGLRDWEQLHEEELRKLKERLTLQSKQAISKVESENEVLKNKIKQFESRYPLVIKEVEKIKSALQAKTTQNEELQQVLEKLKKELEEQQKILRANKDDADKIQAIYMKQIKQLAQKNEDLQREAERLKKISRDVKVEPVYIDRPVEVQKIVERIVEVERVVNKYIENPGNDKRTATVQSENQKLRQQINNILRELKQMQEHYKQTMLGYEQNIKEYQKNTVLYKKEREALAVRIAEQNKQLEMLHSLIERLGAQKTQVRSEADNERIVVHVKQDGTYQKTVEKLPAPSGPSRKKK